MPSPYTDKGEKKLWVICFVL